MTALLPRFLPVLVATLSAGCMVGGTVRPTATPSTVDVAALWEAPNNIASRDLIYGSGGERRAPRDGATFTFVRDDAGGYSPGYDVRSADGLEWSAKLGPEAQTEVAV